MDVTIDVENGGPPGASALKKNKFSVSKVSSPPIVNGDGSEQPPENGHSTQPEVDNTEKPEWSDPTKAAFFLGPNGAVTENDPVINAASGDSPRPSPSPDLNKSGNGGNRFKVNKVGFTEPDVEDEPDSQSTQHCAMNSPSNTYAYDTHNLKTFGQDTLETLPNVDHYRNLMSATGAMRQRPTLAELHDLEPNEIAALLNKGGENGQATQDAGGEDGGKPAQTAGPKFGWIIGVLVRCLLNIFGVMIFLRLSWVVGQAGIMYAIVIILLSAVVTTITTLSMSAICTNGEVKGGGAYYMISRSLGPEFGGAIGLIFAAANAVAIAMYIVGFAETIRDILKEYDMLMVGELHDVRIIGCITALFLLTIAMMSLEWVIRAQLVLLVILTIAIVNFFIGTLIPPTDDKMVRGFVGYSGDAFMMNVGPGFRDGEGFFSVFAIFFPAATGILAGANISGDLKNAQTAIPKGTLLAILISTIVYILMAIVVGATGLKDANGIIVSAITTIFPPSINATDLFNNGTELLTVVMEAVTEPLYVITNSSTTPLSVATTLSEIDSIGQCPAEGCPYGLINDMQIVSLISAWMPITVGGIIAATLSSALASLVAAPKVFQAVAKDHIFPGRAIHFFARGYGGGDEPRRAYLLAFFIAIGCILIGKLNAIAPLISNFFLMSYALINYSCFDASLAKAPGWRPAFKYYSQWIALVGTLLCLVVMFLINWVTALITIVITLFVYMYIHYRKPDVNWGSSTQAHVYRSALQHTLKLVSTSDHVKNFRPQILVLSGFPSDRPALIDFTSNITKNTSLMVCGNIIVNENADRLKDPRGANTRAASWLHKRKVKAFYTQVSAPGIRAGAASLLQCAGVGKMKPNILLSGFKSDWRSASLDDVTEYVDVIHDALSLHYGVGILRLKEGLNFSYLNKDNEDDISPNIPRNMSSASGLMESASTAALRPSPSDVLLDDKANSPYEDPVVVEYTPGNHGDENEAVKFSLAEEKSDKVDSQNNEKKEHNPLRAVDKEMIKYMNRFQHKQAKGTIDVWWLFDDGGLTLLLPYILSKKSQWANCKLRVFVAGSKQIQLDRDKRHMATLLSKFRIDYSHMTVIPDIGKKPKEDSLREFNEMVNEVSKTHNISQEELRENKEKTYRHIRCRELLKHHSHDASLIVLTLPMPKKAFYSSGLYMTWLDTLTRDMPPILLIRGNQDSVLTFYS